MTQPIDHPHADPANYRPGDENEPGSPHFDDSVLQRQREQADPRLQECHTALSAILVQLEEFCENWPLVEEIREVYEHLDDAVMALEPFKKPDRNYKPQRRD